MRTLTRVITNYAVVKKATYVTTLTVFSEMKLRGLVSNSYIHVSVSDLYTYIPTIGLPIPLQEKRWTDRGNIQIAHGNMNVEIMTETAQFLFGENINRIFFAVYS